MDIEAKLKLAKLIEKKRDELAALERQFVRAETEPQRETKVQARKRAAMKPMRRGDVAAVLAASGEPMRAGDVARALGNEGTYATELAAATLYNMKQSGEVVRVGRGLYALAAKASAAPASQTGDQPTVDAIGWV